MFLFYSLFALVGFVYSAQGQSITLPDLSELSQFEAEWCAPNSAPGDRQIQIAEACYGHVRFWDSVSVRALEFRATNGQKFVYVDADFRGIELLRLEITLLGPIHVSGHTNSTDSNPILPTVIEFGQASFEIDKNGEVIAFKSFTIQMNEVIAYR